MSLRDRRSKREKERNSVSTSSLVPFFTDQLHQKYIGLWIAALYCGLMLVVGIKYHVVGDYGVETDFFWSYVPEARQILRGTFVIEDFHGPGYQMLLALAGFVIKDLFHAGIVLSTLAASATLLFCYYLVKALFRADIAFLGTILVAFNPTFVQYSYSGGTDMVFCALVTASAFYLLKEEKLRWRNLILSAVLSGLAYLMRYNGIYIVLAAPVALLLVDPFHLGRNERIKAASLFVAVFLVTIAPWGIYCVIEKGSFFYNKNYLNIAYEMFAKGKVSWDQYWSSDAQKFTSLRQVMFADPWLFAATVVRNIYEHAAGDLGNLLGWHLGFFSLAGLAFLLKEKPGVRVATWLILSACFFGVLLLVFYGERFSLPLLPVYVALALKALTWNKLASIRFWNRVSAGTLVAFLLVVVTASNSYTFNSVNIDSGPREIPVIAEWFHRVYGDSERGKIVVARKPHIAYYLGMEMQFFPYVNTYPELLDQLRNGKASYLFFSLMEAGMRPQFQSLLDPRKAPPGLRPLTYTVSPPAVLYKVEILYETVGPKP